MLIVETIVVFAPFANSKLAFATFVSEFHSLHTFCVVVENSCFGFLSFLRSAVVNEKVGTVFGILFSLLHPDCSHTAILTKDLLNLVLDG